MAETSPSVQGPKTPKEHDEFAEHAARSFNIPLEELRPWLHEIGDDRLFALRKDGHVCAGCIGFPSGHFLLGKPVPSLGVALVFVAPHLRGHGYSFELMRQVLSAARAQGMALSTLHPARLSPYRKVGYEVAGSLFQHRIPLGPVWIRDESETIRVVPMGAGDEAECESFFAEHAARQHGELTRETYLWRRVRKHRGCAADGYLLRDADDCLRGFFYLRRSALSDGHHDLSLSDAWANDAAGYRAILRLARAHNSVAKDLVYYGPIADPILLELGENRCETKLVHQWMLRVLNAPEALQRRGYPAHLEIDVNIEIEDELLVDNSGTWNLALAGGTMKVGPSDRPNARMSIGALAPLMTGLFTATDLSHAGKIEGNAEALRTLDAMFASPHPCVSQYF